jgi:hypothetical protein
MQIQSASAYSSQPFLNIPPQQRVSDIAATAASSASTASLAYSITISEAARNLLATQSNSAATSGSGATAVFETDQGAKNLDIDACFTPAANTGGSAFTLPPLLLPSQKNIDALASHISKTFPQFLAQNSIPFPPASITYDNQGQIQVPPDFPYASEFKQALVNHPTMARELSTVNALTSHLVEMKKSIPFQQEYAAATTRAEADAVVAKYGYLFSANRHYDTIALQFSADGKLSFTADGKPLA